MAFLDSPSANPMPIGSYFRAMMQALSGEAYFQSMANLLKAWTGCRCVGIRVLDANGSVHYQARLGLEDLAESVDQPPVKCNTCSWIGVFTGRVAPQHAPCMTHLGSSWVGDIQAFLAGLPAEERSRFHGSCASQAIRSLVVIPVGAGKGSLATIYFADAGTGILSANTVDMLEGIGSLISGAIRRFDLEEGIRKSEARYRRLTENARDLVFCFELKPEWRLAYTNNLEEMLLGYTPEDAAADPFLGLRLIHPDDKDRFLGLARGEMFRQWVPLRWVRKDGKTIWTEILAIPVYEGDNLVAIEGISRDITERKRLEEQLLRVQRLEAAGRVAAQVAHDFNNLLSPVATYINLIKAGQQPDSPALGYCDTILDTVAQIADINQDLMALGRRASLQLEPTNLNRLVEEVVGRMGGCPSELRVTLSLDPALHQVNGAPSQLARLIANLVSNAREAMLDAGVLTIGTGNARLEDGATHRLVVAPGDYVKLWFSDTGCGIPREIVGKIFDAFFTTKRTDEKRGSGLGLSIVQAIATDHGGWVDVESEPGKGTTFTVYLPALPRDARLRDSRAAMRRWVAALADSRIANHEASAECRGPGSASPPREADVCQPPEDLF